MRFLGRWDLTGHTGPVYALECDRERGYLYSAGSDGIVALWSCTSTKQALAIARTPTAIYALRYIPQAQTLLVGQTTGLVYALKPYEKKLVSAIQAHHHAVMGIGSHFMEPEGWSSGKDGHFLYWDIATVRPTEKLLISEAGLRGFVPLLNRRLFACAGRDGVLYIIERGTHKVIQKIPVESHPLFSVAVSSDESTLWVGAHSGRLYEWEVDTWRLRSVREAHQRAVNALSLSPTGQWLASGGRDRLIHLWEVGTGKLLLSLSGHLRSVNALLWLSNEALASASDDGVIKVWHLEA